MKPQYFLPLLLLTLCACGFHLRGYQEVSSAGASSIAIQSLSAPLVTAEVTSQLQLSDIKIVTASSEAEYMLTIRNEGLDRDVLSVSADTGKVKEYQLTLHVVMSVSDANAKSLVDNESIAVSRDYTFDDSSILGKSNEETALRETLARQVAAQIIRRFNGAIGQ